MTLEARARQLLASAGVTRAPDDPPADAAQFMQWEEFAVPERWTTAIVARYMARGWLPMTLEIARIPVGVVKLHRRRLLAEPQAIVAGRSVRRRARGLTFRFGDDLEPVLEGIAEQHRDNWLEGEIVPVLRELNGRSVEGVRVRATTVRDGDEVVAGEIGYLWSLGYTSLSGFYRRSGVGAVQLRSLARFLAYHRVAVWDLGMDIPYKRELGAVPYRRAAFLEQVDTAIARAVREGERRCDGYGVAEPVPCDDLLRVGPGAKGGDDGTDRSVGYHDR